MNVSPHYSPDGKKIAFISTGERTGIIAPRASRWRTHLGRNARSQVVSDERRVGRRHPVDAGQPGALRDDERGQFTTGAHMFEMPVVRVSWRRQGGAARRRSRGAAILDEPQQDGSKLAFREVRARDMGDVVVLDVASKKTQHSPTSIPELKQLALGDLKPIS
jgi:Tol biopolymer transport system component